jgi:hypothetical protein
MLPRTSIGLLTLGLLVVTDSGRQGVRAQSPNLGGEARSQVIADLTPLARIGCDSCDGPEQFGVVLALAVGEDQVVVADRAAPHVRVFALDGTLRATLGEEGEGPGELQYPLAVGSGEDGLTVVDMRQQRVIMLAPDGTERGRSQAGQFPLAAAFTPDGESLYLAVANWAESTAGIVQWRGATRDFATVLGSMRGLLMAELGEPTMYFSLAVAPDGSFVVGEGSEVYRLQGFTRDGTRRFETFREIPRLPKTDDEIAAEEAASERARARMGGSPEGPGITREVDPLKRHFSLDALRVDDDGRIWVRTDRGDPTTIFDVFDSTGGYRGEVKLPARARAFAVGRGLLVAAELDDFDVATVATYRLEWR